MVAVQVEFIDGTLDNFEGDKAYYDKENNMFTICGFGFQILLPREFVKGFRTEHKKPSSTA